MSRTRFYNPQFDLFLPSIVDLRFRDQKDTMERPFFSLSKSKRMKPIEYVNENDGIFVTVQPHQDYGMATIWDADILIWAASVLCDLKNRGTNDIPREIKFQPHDALKAIGRSTGGRDYSQLRDALERLKTTVVTTNIVLAFLKANGINPAGQSPDSEGRRGARDLRQEVRSSSQGVAALFANSLPYSPGIAIRHQTRHG